MLDTYYNNVNPDLLARIPASAKKVLEIGCGTGALAKAFKLINPGVLYYGVEYNKSACVRNIESSIDKLLIGNAESIKFDQDWSDFDCIVYGDVLEHLIDPDSLIEYHKSLLSSSGVFITCIPNAQHWSMILTLINGTFPRLDSGLFDRTHLRWFTHDDASNLFVRNGLSILSQFGRCYGSMQQSRSLTQLLSPLLKHLSIDEEFFLSRISPLQWVITASRNPQESLSIHALTMASSQAGMAPVRMHQPLDSVNSFPQVDVVYSDNLQYFIDIELTSPTILIWQRPSLDPKLHSVLINHLITKGYIIVVEFDDDPSSWNDIINNDFFVFRCAHAVQVSTDLIRDQLLPYNAEISVFPNSVASLHEPINPYTPGTGPLRIFFGALNRQNDYKLFLEGINSLACEFQEKLHFEIVHDSQFYSLLQTPYKKFSPTLEYQEYCQKLSSCHVSWMPLAYNQFNSHKSDLKYLEASSRGLVSIASSIVYGNVITNGLNGLIADTPEEFILSVKKLLHSPTLFSDIAANARSYVRETRLQSYQSASRLRWYQSLLSRREALLLDLNHRSPELS